MLEPIPSEKDIPVPVLCEVPVKANIIDTRSSVDASVIEAAHNYLILAAASQAQIAQPVEQRTENTGNPLNYLRSL